MPRLVILTTWMVASACSSTDGAPAKADAGDASGGVSSGGKASGGTGGETSSGGIAGSGGRSAGGATNTGGGATGGATSSGGSVSDAAPPDPDRCAPLPLEGRSVNVSPGEDLAARVQAAESGDTLLLENGTYTLPGTILRFRKSRVTLRSRSGDRDAVVLDGARSASTGEVVSITASDVTIADVTIANAYTHAVHVQPGEGTDVLRTVLYNVRITDALEQAIKINLDASETHFPDGGILACSHLELTDAGRSAVRNDCYTGGVDGHGARDWVIRDNRIEGFWCPQGLSEHGVHFWTGSRDTIVERNVIRNVARGVGFGLGENTASSTDAWRTYPDAPCGSRTPVGHYGGIVRNNFVSADDARLFASASGFDSGVTLEQACGAGVFHNTLFGTTPPLSSAVEWRFGNTSATVTNNLANARFRDRGGGATATQGGNVENATAAFFVNAATGDLHLGGGAAGVVGTGIATPGGVCDDDIDGEARTAARDVGADQRER